MNVAETTESLDRLWKPFALPARQPPVDEAVAIVMTTARGPERLLMQPPDHGVVNAMQKMLRGRRKWLDVPGTRTDVHEFCSVVLENLGLPRSLLSAVAVAETIQLTFHGNLPPEAFEFPWEFTLAEATRPHRARAAYRPGRSFLILRHYEEDQPAATPPSDAAPTSLLVVQSAPGPIGAEYSFSSECRLVQSALAFGDDEPLTDPDRQTLQSRVVEIRPDVVHLTGVDARQGRVLLGAADPSASPSGPDGMYFHEGGQPTVLSYDDLAAVLTAGGLPHLVSFNIYNSSVGALEVVKRGAGAAIGFQGDVDDLVAEQFFANFYSHWRRSGWCLLDAYLGAWASLAAYSDKVRGTGIVLWSRQPLVEPRKPQTRAFRGTGTGRGTGTATGAGTGAGVFTGTVATTATVTPPAVAVNAADHIDVDYVHPTELNYSLLHNNANIVPKLVIRRQKPGPYSNIGVEVRLSAGVRDALYRVTLRLDDREPRIDLHDKVRVPLTSELIRTLGESLFSTIYLKVHWDTRVLREETHRVAFMPVDEWKYDDTNARWLPSFVFPRDPAVRDVIAAAQRYLVALRDDSGAGFDGYQSDEPSGTTISARARNIDAQVQAIWWALVHDYALGYINPPPNYSDDAQRLRRPSEIIQGRRGTCIDLALLLASCLEWVEIHPVIFMLNDHAFPGYWRNEESHKRFGQLQLLAATTAPDAGAADAETAKARITDRDAHNDPWMIGRAAFGEISKLVADGHLVPLESVALTSRGSFWASVEEGVGNLRSKRQFHSLFDLRTARNNKVTPLPIWSSYV